MTIDIARAIGAVTRKVELREHDGREARVLIATRTYSTERADLWDAITNPERLPRWFSPVSGDLRLGGKYQIEGNAGGDITACDPPTHLALDWEMHGNKSWVRVTLSDEPKGDTLLRLEHIAHYTDQTWAQFGPGAGGVGWGLALIGLQEHFAQTPALTPEQATEWHTTAEGRTFIRQSSKAWGEADVDSGTEPAEARAAAERTRAFYTGDDPPNDGDSEGGRDGAN